MTIRLTRRGTLAAIGATLASPATAQGAWPSKTVRMIVPFPPGQAADVFTRMMAERLTEAWKQQVVVENKAGGGGIPALEAGKAAAPDGYTIMNITSGTAGVNPSLYGDKLPYKPLVDFIPITNMVRAPLVIVAHPTFPASTIPELIALAKKEPGKHFYASAGPGTAQHLSMELFKLKTGIDIVHTPYKGSGPALADLLGGHVKLMMDSTTSSMGAIRDGAARQHPDHRRHGEGIRYGRLDGLRRAGQDAAPDRRQDQRRHAGRHARSRLHQEGRGAGRHPRPRHARRVCGVREVRDRNLGRGGARHRHQAGFLRSRPSASAQTRWKAGPLRPRVTRAPPPQTGEES
jgi:hypothetical protein